MTMIHANHAGKNLSISLVNNPTTSAINNKLTTNAANQGVITLTYSIAFAETKKIIAIENEIKMLSILLPSNNFVFPRRANVTLKTNKNPKTGMNVAIPDKSIDTIYGCPPAPVELFLGIIAIPAITNPIIIMPIIHGAFC